MFVNLVKESDFNRRNMTKANTRATRPLPANYNQINDLDISPKRKRRKISSKKIFWSCFVLLFAMCLLVIYLIVDNKRKSCIKINDSNNVCTNRSCIISASTILQTIDETVSPCDDFYQFACGKSSINYDNHNSHLIVNQAQKRLNLELKSLLESLRYVDQPEHIQKISQFYQSCINMEKIEELDIEPLSDTIEELGGWPVLLGDKWQSDRLFWFNWLNTYVMMRKIGVNADSIIKLRVDTDPANNTRQTIYLDQPRFIFDRNRHNNSDAYFNLMVHIAVMMSADPVIAKMDMFDVIDFEKSLVNISVSEEDHSNISFVNNNYYYMQVRQIQSLAPNISWSRLLTEFVGTPIKSDTEVIVLVPSYIKNLSELLWRTSPRVIANYLIWHVIYTSLPLLSNKWSKEREKYLSEVDKNHINENRWEKCIKQAKHYMPHTLGSIYVKTHFNTEDKAEVVAMMDNIRLSFIETLDYNIWMTDEVRRRAQEKALIMDLRIGFPPELLDVDIMDSVVSSLLIGENYFVNIKNLNVWRAREIMNTYKQSNKKEKSSWKSFLNAADASIAYKKDSNAFMISAGLLNHDLIKPDQPRYLNYGALGLIIGQKIIRGFDETGRLYDENGTYHNWWDHDTELNYYKQKQCFLDQYLKSNYAVSSLSFKTRISLIEKSIADIAGHRYALNAFKSYDSSNKVANGLPSLSYSIDQLFWINAANTICLKYSQNLINASLYESSRYRINTVVSNINEFADTFQCELGSPMNPESKCLLW